jgi:hypothetical protein
LPDGTHIFKPIILISDYFKRLGMENFGTFYGHSEYFEVTWLYVVDVWYILWLFGVLSNIFWYILPRKIWQPCRRER